MGYPPTAFRGKGVVPVYVNTGSFLTLQRNRLLKAAHSASPTDHGSDVTLTVNSVKVRQMLTLSMSVHLSLKEGGDGGTGALR